MTRLPLILSYSESWKHFYDLRKFVLDSIKTTHYVSIKQYLWQRLVFYLVYSID